MAPTGIEDAGLFQMHAPQLQPKRWVHVFHSAAL